MPSLSILTSLASHPIDSTILLLRVGLTIPSVVVGHVLSSLDHMDGAHTQTASPLAANTTSPAEHQPAPNDKSQKHDLPAHHLGVAVDAHTVTYRHVHPLDPPLSARLPSRTLPAPDRRSFSSVSHPRIYSHARSASDTMPTHALMLGRLPSTPVIAAVRSSDLESVDTSAELVPPLVTSTPYRPLPTSADTSLESDNSLVAASANSTPYEIYLGPQPPSFIHRRRMQALDSPVRPNQLPNVIRSVPVTIRPDRSEWTGTPVVPPDPIVRPKHLSKWRQEQMKRTRPPRPVAGARERPIPTMHGPLTLPYARNPSGADAIVADQSAYMSHVFGLRAMPDPIPSQSPAPPAATARVASESSGAESGSRVVSGSSTGSNPTANQSGSTETSYVSAGGTTHHRPVVVRDPNQVIGLRKPVEEAFHQGLSKEEAALAVQKLASVRPTHVEVTRSPDARAALGVATPRIVIPSLSPIPGSPLDGGKARQVDEAIHSHSAGAGTWHIPPAVFNAIASLPPRATEQEALAHLQAFKPTTPAATDRNSSGSSGEWTTVVGRNPPPRHRQGNPMKHLVRLQPSPAMHRPPPPSAASSPTKPAQPSERVLTLDSLFEKFGQSNMGEPVKRARSASLTLSSQPTVTMQPSTAPIPAVADSRPAHHGFPSAANKPTHTAKRKSDPPTPLAGSARAPLFTVKGAQPRTPSIAGKGQQPRTPSGKSATGGSPGPLGETPINAPAREDPPPVDGTKDHDKGKQPKARAASHGRTVSDGAHPAAPVQHAKSPKPGARAPSKVVAKPHSSPQLDTTEATASQPASSTTPRDAKSASHRAKGTPGAGKLLKRSSKVTPAAAPAVPSA